MLFEVTGGSSARERLHEPIRWSAFLGAWPLVPGPFHPAGWFYVAAGAFVITLKETRELVEGHHGPTAVFRVLVLVMIARRGEHLRPDPHDARDRQRPLSHRATTTRPEEHAVTAPVLVVQHEPECPPGLVGAWLAEAGLTLDVAQPYAGAALPSDLTGHAGLVVLGGHMGANDDDAYPWLSGTKALVRAGAAGAVPVLGICLGHQLAAVALGGEVRLNPDGIRRGVLDMGWVAAAALDPVAAGCGARAVHLAPRHRHPRARGHRGPGPRRDGRAARPRGTPRRSGACSATPKPTRGSSPDGRRGAGPRQGPTTG